MPHPRRVRAAVVAGLLLVAGVAGCGDSDEETISGLTVTGDFGKEPSLKVDKLDVDTVETAVLITGDGDPIAADSSAESRIYLAKGSDGSKLASNYEDPEPFSVVVSEQPAPIRDALAGTAVGSRVALAMPATDLYGPQGNPQLGVTATDDVVLIFDLIELTEAPEPPLDGPKGDEVEPPADAPKVVEKDGQVTGLDFSDAPKKDPQKLQVIPLVNGEGAAVKEGDTIIANYLGTKWGAEEKPFDNSFGSGQPPSFPIAPGGVIDGWVEGLVGVKVGSRVMLVIPPDQGYGAQGNPDIEVTGKDTLVFVIDVLGIGA